MTNHLFLVGGRDWLELEGSQGFYPADLPPDWRVAYYGLHFGCVWLSRSVWWSCGTALEQSWLDETRKGFHFLLEPPSPEHRRAGLLERRPGGFYEAGHDSLVWFDAASDLSSLAAVLRSRGTRPGTSFLLSRDGDQAMIERVGTLFSLLGLGAVNQVG